MVDPTQSDSHCMYFRYKGTVIGQRYGRGSGPILLDDVQCVGYETRLADCPHRQWTYHNCDHSQDVSVSCGKSPVQQGKRAVGIYISLHGMLA